MRVAIRVESAADFAAAHQRLVARARERLELVKNAAYWDAKRVPKVDRMVLLPMPEANARTAALLSGQVDWVENPAPDALPQIKHFRTSRLDMIYSGFGQNSIH